MRRASCDFDPLGNFVPWALDVCPEFDNEVVILLLSAALGYWLAGAALYPLERRLVRTRSESPTTEIMLCRRR